MLGWAWMMGFRLKKKIKARCLDVWDEGRVRYGSDATMVYCGGIWIFDGEEWLAGLGALLLGSAKGPRG